MELLVLEDKMGNNNIFLYMFNICIYKLGFVFVFENCLIIIFLSSVI